MATKVQCLRCPASAHSTNPTWQTSFGLTQRHSSEEAGIEGGPTPEPGMSTLRIHATDVGDNPL